jgi:hypothetical protein
MLSDEQVRNFLIEKKRLQDYCDNDPSEVESIAATDPQFRQICSDLNWKASILMAAQRHSDGGLIAPVSEAFISEWRGYEERWHYVICFIGLAESFGTVREFIKEAAAADLSESPPKEIALRKPSDADALEISDALKRAPKLTTSYQEQSIEKLLSLGEIYAEDIDSDYDGDAFDGRLAWEELKGEAQLDVAAVLSRNGAAPKILVPKAINDNVGGDLLSLYDLWKDARKAYIHGSPLSSLCLSRAILEKLLRRFYKIDERELDLLIREYKKQFRARESEISKMHALRMSANGILHEGTDNNFPLRQVINDPEASALDALKLLQILIEAASLRKT